MPSRIKICKPLLYKLLHFARGRVELCLPGPNVLCMNRDVLSMDIQIKGIAAPINGVCPAWRSRLGSGWQKVSAI